MNLLELIIEIDEIENNFSTFMCKGFVIRGENARYLPKELEVEYPSDYKYFRIRNSFIFILEQEVAIITQSSKSIIEIFKKELLQDPSYAVLCYPILRTGVYTW